MQRLTTLMITLLTALTVSACGGSSDRSEANQTDSSPKVVSVKSDFVFMSDFVEALQGAGVTCADYTKKAEPSILTKDEGSCTHNGSTIYLALFGDAKTTPELVDSLRGFGGYFLTSNNWAINVEDEATAKELQKLLGVNAL